MVHTAEHFIRVRRLIIQLFAALPWQLLAAVLDS